MVNIRQSDIAKQLNVSRVTVSKALRDHPDISSRMKESVTAAARKLGYVPNLIARQLNSKRTYTIGVVIPDLENIWFAYLADSIIDYATEKKYHVILTVSRENKDIEKQNLENLIGMRVDGLLVCVSQGTTDNQLFKVAAKMGIPLVFFDRALENLEFSRAVFDDKTGAIYAMNQIIEAGYTKIAHFAGYSQTNVGKTRIEGYIEALKENKIPVRKEWIIEGGFEFKDGYEAFRKIHSSGKMPEIIFTVNHMVALGVYKAAREAGIKIPSDLGIFGFGFSEYTDLFDPPMTVINQDPRNLGIEAAKLVINEIDKKPKHLKTIIHIDETFLWRKSVDRKSNKKN